MDVDKIIREGDFLPSECLRLQEFAGEIWELKQALNRAVHQEKATSEKLRVMERHAREAIENNERLSKEMKALHAKILDLEAANFGYREALQTSKETSGVAKARISSLSNKLQKYEQEIRAFNISNKILKENMYVVAMIFHVYSSLIICFSRDKMKREMKDYKLKIKRKNEVKTSRFENEKLSLTEEISLQDALQAKVEEQERTIADLIRRNNILESVVFSDHLAASPLLKSMTS